MPVFIVLVWLALVSSQLLEAMDFKEEEDEEWLLVEEPFEQQAKSIEAALFAAYESYYFLCTISLPQYQPQAVRKTLVAIKKILKLFKELCHEVDCESCIKTDFGLKIMHIEWASSTVDSLPFQFKRQRDMVNEIKRRSVELENQVFRMYSAAKRFHYYELCKQVLAIWQEIKLLHEPCYEERLNRLLEIYFDAYRKRNGCYLVIVL